MNKLDFKIESINQDLIDDLHKKVGQKVKKLREKHNISQLELSYLLGFKSLSIVSGSETYYKRKGSSKGQHFSIEHIYKICLVLDEDFADFFKID
ncbi:MAG: helix-turn-helix transcriptional regulator [Candidatus Cloacimonadota bacterium]|nr:helix-turn-helix transcriptional regulator [Candidatus Cloacimonadota bacterium]